MIYDDEAGAYTGKTVNLNLPRPTRRLDDWGQDATLEELLDIQGKPRPDDWTPRPPDIPPARAGGLLGALFDALWQSIQAELDRRERDRWRANLDRRLAELRRRDEYSYNDDLGAQAVIPPVVNLPAEIPPPPSRGVWVHLEDLPPGETEITIRVRHLPAEIPPPPRRIRPKGF